KMKWLAGSLTFFNAAAFVALLTGIMAHGLSRPVAIFSVLVALVLGFFAYWMTDDVPLRVRRPKSPPPPPAPKSKRAQRRAARAGITVGAVEAPRWKYRSTWFWLVAVFFAIFAFRSFCWLIYWYVNEVKVQSPNT